MIATHRCYDGPAAVIEADSRPCVVVSIRQTRQQQRRALIRYTDGDRERELVNADQLEPIEATT